MGVRTSSIFYRRGVPNNYRTFGILVQANYPVIQPQSLFQRFAIFKMF